MIRMRLERIIALLLIGIPGACGVLGWKWMKDAVYDALASEGFFYTLFTDWQLYIGVLLFIAALFFIGGFIFYRDKKQNRIKLNFRRKPRT